MTDEQNKEGKGADGEGKVEWKNIPLETLIFPRLG